jgi:hypothetical protein
VTDPEHMTDAVELVREILSSDNEDWKTWAWLIQELQCIVCGMPCARRISRRKIHQLVGVVSVHAQFA